MASASGRLAGQVAIVTGAGSVGEGFGTGKAISVLFARAGARVVLVDRDASRADDTRCLIEEEGGEAAIVVADIAEPSSWERIVDTVVDRFGTVDVLVNNAALANTIAPGLIATPHRAHLLAEHGLDEANFRLADKTCLGIEGEPWDVAYAALFLASPEGRYLTGVVLPVDGGSISRRH